jgi:hypothetical protein
MGYAASGLQGGFIVGQFLCLFGREAMAVRVQDVEEITRHEQTTELILLRSDSCSPNQVSGPGHIIAF